MKNLFAIGMIAFAIAAGPATRPTTDTTLPEIADKSLEIATKAVAIAKDAALARLVNSPSYRAAASDLKAKEATLEATRLNGSQDEKLSASASYNQSRLKIRKLTADAIDNDAAVKSAESQLQITIREVADAKIALDHRREKEQSDKQQRDKEERSRQFHRPFAQREEKIAAIDAAMKVPISDDEKNDPYVLYCRRARLVVDAARVAQSYLDQDENLIHSIEYAKLIGKCAEVTLQWRKAISEREKEYPSAVLLKDEILKMGGMAMAFGIEEAVRDDARKNTRENADLEIQVSDSKAMLKIMTSRSINDKKFDDGLNEVLHLLNSREGTAPVLPPPPAK